MSSFNKTFVRYGLLLRKEAKKSHRQEFKAVQEDRCSNNRPKFIRSSSKRKKIFNLTTQVKKELRKFQIENTKMKIKITKLCHYRKVEEIERRRTCQEKIPHDLLVAFQTKIGSERQPVKIRGVRLLSIIGPILVGNLARKLRVWSEEFGALNDSHESSRQNKFTVTRPVQWSCYQKLIKGHAKQRKSEEQKWKVLGG